MSSGLLHQQQTNKDLPPLPPSAQQNVSGAKQNSRRVRKISRVSKILNVFNPKYGMVWIFLAMVHNAFHVFIFRKHFYIEVNLNWLPRTLQNNCFMLLRTDIILCEVLSLSMTQMIQNFTSNRTNYILYCYSLFPYKRIFTSFMLVYL